MVVATMAWLSGATKNLHYRQLFAPRHHQKSTSSSTLGILTFDVAKTMSRLVSLYKSLSDDQLLKLRKEIMRSKGVAYLNSKDEGFLLNLAYSERLEDLNQVAITVARFGQKCSDLGLNRFDLIYSDLKLGVIDLGKLEYNTKHVLKIIERMEKSISATANLHAALESLAELEASERKIERWKNTIGPKQISNLEYIKQKIVVQRKQVQHYRETSLWYKGFDKSVGHMARIVCVVYARICSVFEPYISDLPFFSNNSNLRLVSNHNKRQNFWIRQDDENEYEDPDKNEKPNSKSGPVPNNNKRFKVRFFSHGLNPSSQDREIESTTIQRNREATMTNYNHHVFALAPPHTVGGSGLSLRYANVIICAEQCLYAPATIGGEAREALYEMLPARLKGTVRAKLKSNRLKRDDEDCDGHSLAEGWRDALEEIVGWLVPLAHDTITWQAERNMERQKFDWKPRVLLLQTLHYSDLEKTEAAIVEVLVGLSCIYRFENRCLAGSSATVQYI